MIKAIFYSKFDVKEGPKVVHQVPLGSITPSASSGGPLVPFSALSSVVIPRQSHCGHPLSLLCHPYRLLTHPICLASPDYPRNEFLFSFSLLLHHAAPHPAYASVTSKLAALFRHLETTSRFLSSDTSAHDTGKIYALCEILLEDLNNYSEAMIPIDEANTLNVKLFPVYPPPPSLAPHHVPLATVRLDRLTDEDWDLTLLRILPHIDGVASLRAIARKADADYKLVRKAVAHLVYYGCVVLLDVFNFGASYAPTGDMSGLVEDKALQEEGRQYVLTLEAGRAAARRGEFDRLKLVELYFSLKQGLSLRNWCMEHAEVVGLVDVRRFITFGVIKGFLYRVHKYAIASRHDSQAEIVAEGETAPPRKEDAELARFLDGTHCFDEICTELTISERELLGRLRAYGEVQIVHK